MPCSTISRRSMSRWRPGRGQTSSSTCWDGRLTAGACEHCQSQGWQGWAKNRPCPDVLSHRRSRRRVSDLRQRRRTAVPGTLEHGREPDPLYLGALFNGDAGEARPRSEEHTSELQSLMRNSYAVFCLKKKKTQTH